ncbi:MAG: DNA helicase RecQ [Prevotellaceae bacterium]|jgi:ATP-dependent DNA helicase RecQ|nr:DNA helicase RecQ [Prevotellaceae bacterium]
MDNTDDTYLRSCLKKFFGFDTFIGNQKAIIRSLLYGKDTFVLMPTGSGKSLCYQLPALISEGTAIVVSPLIALMKNQVDHMCSFVLEEGIASFLNSTLNRAEAQQVKDNVLQGKTKMLYVAPEALANEDNLAFLRKVKISFYAIDEAHCISEWGHDFRPEYRKIRSSVNLLGSAPIIALTATATPKVQHDIQRNLDMLHAAVFRSSFNRPNLFYEVRPKVDAAKEIVRYAKQREGQSGIVYCLTRKEVESLSELLCLNGVRSLPYHAGLSPATRSTNQDKFLMEEADVMVATIAFGMGIDKPDVRFVIHYDMPKSLEGYYQETGRAGRDGHEGRCIAFYSPKDMHRLEKLTCTKASATEQEISRQLLAEVSAYAESTLCRRKLLLSYFGEDYNEEKCDNCDNCTNPSSAVEGQEYVRLLLSTVCAVRESVRDDHVVSIIRGEATVHVRASNHHELDVFGQGQDKDKRFWSSVVKQSLLHKLAKKDVEPYGQLQLTEKGRAFLAQPHSISLASSRDFSHCTGDDEISGGGGKWHSGGYDRELFTMLKNVLVSESRRCKLKPFVMFQDTSLQDMAILYPTTIEELQSCHGVGAGKAQKFGKPFVELVAKYVKERGIERSQDMVVKSAPHKSANKVFIIHSIDRKIDMEDIASAKKLRLDDVLLEIEAIVSSGTKLNIDYYIERQVEEDKLADMLEYFATEAQSDSVQEALAALGSSYTETEVRLARIKFLSENGN